MLSHHRANQPSATAQCSQRQQHENHLKQCRGISFSHLKKTSSSPASFHLRALLSLFVVLVTWASLLHTAAAQPHGDRQRSAPAPDLPAWKGASLLVVDTRPPPDLALLMPPIRSNEDATRTTLGSPAKRAIDTDPSATPTDFSVPKPFDTALSNNFTDSCANFFKRLLSDQSFNNCHPFSLLLQTSSGFFDASKSFIRITQTLEATCAVNSTQCTGTMDSFARELVTQGACKVDYDNDNPQVLQAYNGLLAYESLYQASCLRDDEGSYCYANAVTNTSATADSYPYYLPLGVELPGGARPTCNSCLQDAMAIFSSFAPNTTQPISKTYNAAAQQISIGCGNTFVNVTAAPLKAGASTTSITFTPTITLLLMVLLFFFQ